MILKKSFFSLIKHFGIKILGVLSSSIIVFFLQKKYGNTVQGFYGVLSNSILLLTILSHFGIPSLVSLQMAYYKNYNIKSKRIVNNCLKTLLVIQPIFVPLYIYQFYNLTYSFIDVIILSLVILFNVLIYFYAFVLRGLNEYGWMIFFTETSRWILLLITLFIFDNLIEIKTLIIYSIFFSSGITFILAYIKVKPQGIRLNLTNGVDFKRTKIILLKSTPLMMVSFGLLCMQQINIIQLSYYKSFEDVGLFNFTNKYLMLTIMPVSVISAKYAHLSSEYFYQKNFYKLRKTLGFSTLISISITSISLLFLYFFSEIFFDFANQVFNSRLYLLIGVSMLFFSIYGFWISFLTQIKKSKQVVLILAISIIVNILLNYFLTPWYSFYGTAFSDLVSNLITLVLSTLLISKFIINELK